MQSILGGRKNLESLDSFMFGLPTERCHPPERWTLFHSSAFLEMPSQTIPKRSVSWVTSDGIKWAVEINCQVSLHSLRRVALTQERAHSVKCWWPQSLPRTSSSLSPSHDFYFHFKRRTRHIIFSSPLSGSRLGSPYPRTSCVSLQTLIYWGRLSVSLLSVSLCMSHAPWRQCLWVPVSSKAQHYAWHRLSSSIMLESINVSLCYLHS